MSQLELTGPQERWDSTFSKLGRSCPPQRADERAIDYQRRLARVGKKYIPAAEELARVDFHELPDSLVPRFSEMMRACVEANLMRTDNMRDGETRAIHKSDVSGMRSVEWVGPRSFIHDLALPCRRVTKINAPAQQTLYSANRAHLSGLW